MEEEIVYLGSHISLCAPDYFLSAAKEAKSYDENCFMFYTGAPQNSKRVDVGRMKILEGRKYCEENGISLDKCVIHAPYIINLANNGNEDNLRFGIAFLKEEVRRCIAFGIPNLVLHPGARKEMELSASLDVLIASLKEVIDSESKVRICLETMAGKGSEVGRSFEEISYVLKAIDDTVHLGVCLDTCHVFDAGYDISNVDEVLKEFDDAIGLSNLHVIHLNDSKTYLGSHKDRHENLGYGAIGYKTLRQIAFHPLLKGIPKILETPWVGKKPPYKKEIAMLRGDFEEGWREEI